jgi:hypothetical protein
MGIRFSPNPLEGKESDGRELAQRSRDYSCRFLDCGDWTPLSRSVSRRPPGPGRYGEASCHCKPVRDPFMIDFLSVKEAGTNPGIFSKYSFKIFNRYKAIIKPMRLHDAHYRPQWAMVERCLWVLIGMVRVGRPIPP